MGPDTTEFLQKFNIQYGIFGVGGLNEKGQLLDFTPEEASISQSIMKNSEERILIADHSKMNRYAPVITSILSDIDMLIMDAIAEPIRELCQQFEIETFEVGPTPGQATC